MGGGGYWCIRTCGGLRCRGPRRMGGWGGGQELIAHRAGGASAHRACSQLSSQHMSQSAEMSPK